MQVDRRMIHPRNCCNNSTLVPHRHSIFAIPLCPVVNLAQRWCLTWAWVRESCILVASGQTRKKHQNTKTSEQTYIRVALVCKNLLTYGSLKLWSPSFFVKVKFAFVFVVPKLGPSTLAQFDGVLSGHRLATCFKTWGSIKCADPSGNVVVIMQVPLLLMMVVVVEQKVCFWNKRKRKQSV